MLGIIAVNKTGSNPSTHRVFMLINGDLKINNMESVSYDDGAMEKN